MSLAQQSELESLSTEEQHEKSYQEQVMEKLMEFDRFVSNSRDENEIISDKFDQFLARQEKAQTEADESLLEDITLFLNENMKIFQKDHLQDTQTLKNEVEEYIRGCNTYKNKLQQCQEEAKKKEDEHKVEMESCKEYLQTVENDLANMKQGYESQIQDLLQKLAQTTQEKQDLENKMDKASEESKKDKEALKVTQDRLAKQNISVEQNTVMYDVMIHVRHMLSLVTTQPGQNGWMIKFKDYNDYIKRKIMKVQRITALGYENKGKSYLLSRLMSKLIPNGTHVTTSGICAIYPVDQQEPYLCLDVPGNNVPIRKIELEEMFKDQIDRSDQFETEKRFFADNALLEKLTRDFVTHHSEILLIVVNKLSRDDQTMIRSVNLNASSESQRVFILHNFKDSETLEQIKDRIQEDIIGTFNVREKHVSSDLGISYLEEFEVNGKFRAVEHIIYAREGTPAGEKYNESSIKYLRQQFQGAQHAKPFDMVGSFFHYMSEKYLSYYEKHENNTGDDHLRILVQDAKNNQEVELTESEYVEKMEQNEELMPLKIMLDKPELFKLKPSAYNQMGQVSLLNRFKNLDSCLTIYKKSDTERQLVLQCDCNGAIDGDLEVKIDRYQENPTQNLDRIILKGVIKNEMEEKLKGKELYNKINDSRTFGNFEVISPPFDLENFQIGEPMIAPETPGQLVVHWTLLKSMNKVSKKQDV